MPSFCSIVIQISKFHFWLVNNCSNIEGKNIFFAYLSKMCHLLPKKLMLVSRKNPQNNCFTWGPQHGQNGIWNLQIFFTVSRNRYNTINATQDNLRNTSRTNKSTMKKKIQKRCCAALKGRALQKLFFHRTRWA